MKRNAVFRIEDRIFSREKTLAADTGFLRIFTFEFLQGTYESLDDPDKIVLTESLAQKIFGRNDPIGKTIEYGQDMLLEVSAVIQDVPPNSHLQFDALISWDTFRRYDAWGNLNAYTYLLLKPDATVEAVREKMPAVLATFHDLIARDYDATYQPVFEKLTDIHFAQPLDEDIAVKRKKTNLYLLAS